MARRFFAPLGMALLCAHCALAGLAGAFAVGAGLTLFGVSLAWVAPPVLIIGGFVAYVWSGRQKDCAV